MHHVRIPCAFTVTALLSPAVQASPGATTRPVSVSVLESARRALQDEDAPRAMQQLGGDRPDKFEVASEPLRATLLARAAQQNGRDDIAAPLLQALFDHHVARGDRRLAARYAVRFGDVLIAAGHPREAVAWFERADASELVLRAGLGQARALRLAADHPAALAKIEELRPLDLPSDQALRPALLAEAARCAHANRRPAQGLRYLTALWVDHPADSHTYPLPYRAAAEDNPFAGIATAELTRQAGPIGVITRAEHLLDANANRQALNLVSEFMTDDLELSCRARFVAGSANRKLRQYTRALAELDPVARDCPQQAAQALYLLGRVSAFRGQPERAIGYYDRLVAAYPAHPYADDVLFFAGDQLTQQGQHQAADRYYRQVEENYPAGDYLEEARWRIAWGAYLRGEMSTARKQLDHIARTTTDTQAKLPHYQRAVYWRARLDANRAAAAELDALARLDPGSYYGVQARALLKRLAPPLAAELDRWLSTQARAVAAGAASAIPELPRIPELQLGLACHDAGLDPEARAVLASVDLEELPLPALQAVADLMARSGDVHAAHWVLRKRAEEELQGLPSAEDRVWWHTGFPQGYHQSVQSWAGTRKLDENLIYGLIREESAFDAPVVSWAGAVGLMQLMPATAREEAALEKLADFAVDRLTEPDLNIRLGSAHIARRISTFKGNHALAIASYNAGPGAVRRWLKTAPGKDLDVFIESIPVEQTRNYTKRVLHAWAVYRFLYAPEAPFVDVAASVE